MKYGVGPTLAPDVTGQYPQLSAGQLPVVAVAISKDLSGHTFATYTLGPFNTTNLWAVALFYVAYTVNTATAYAIDGRLCTAWETAQPMEVSLLEVNDNQTCITFKLQYNNIDLIS